MEVPVQSVRKALHLLDQIILADTAGVTLSLTALARRMAMPANSVHNLLKTLIACGYVAQPARGVYVPGFRCRQIGRMNSLAMPERRQAVTDRLRSFVDAVGEACVLTVLVGGERVVLAHVDSNQAIRVARSTIDQASFYEVPTGRMLAAMAGNDELEQIIEHHGMPAERWNGITDAAALRKALAAIRRQGWCRVPTTGKELIAWACPVASRTGEPWAAVGTFVPAFRCSRARGQEVLRALHRVAAAVSDEISTALPMTAAST